MNIPKKLEDTRWQSTHFAIEDLENKINELIDYLQANKPVGCCCIKKHSTGEVSKKDKYLCYTCNQWGIVGEHECEASKGECDVMCNECMPPKPMNDHKYLKGVIIHERTDCPPDTLYMVNENLFDKVIPPEQENEFFKLIMEYKLSDFTHMAKMISKELKSEYISKEKIKEYVSDKLNCYSNTDYRVALKDLSESLGLGD